MVFFVEWYIGEGLNLTRTVPVYAPEIVNF
jgi:hypothetical protein